MTMAQMMGASVAHEAPSHHLTDELLLDYASGNLDEASSLMVATHLTLCPECRQRLETMEQLGGVLLNEVAPVEMASDAFERVMAALDSCESAGPARSRRRTEPANDNPVFPVVLQDYIGSDLADVSWKKVGMGVETSEIRLTDASKRAFLLKVAAGRAVPQHTHDGNEYVMVLAGSYRDEAGQFCAGDVEIADGTVDHRPVADEGEDCICLVVLDAPVRLTGKFGALLNMFVKV